MSMRLRSIHRIQRFCSQHIEKPSCSSSNSLRFISSFSNSVSKKPAPFCHSKAATSISFPYPTCFTTASYSSSRKPREPRSDYSDGEVEPIELWEEEDDVEPEIGDGGDGGGIVFQNCSWGARVLSIAQEVLQQFDDDLKLFALKTTPRGYIYVRLDKLSKQYGCPSLDEIESFNREYKKRLEEVGATGEIPEDLALEVSSPSADRLLKVPEDLLRFQDMPMVVKYVEDSEKKGPEKHGVYFLDSIEIESSCCVWKLADVKENRDPLAKGRPLSRKRKDWRLKLSYEMIKRVNICVTY